MHYLVAFYHVLGKERINQTRNYELEPRGS